MITSFLSSFIVFCLVIAYVTRKHRRMEENAIKDFWEREARANNTRKKPLEHLPYITIPFDSLPMETMKDNPDVAEYRTLLTSLSSQKIVNLTGYTNTDLKLKYGTATITELSEYDQNYTVLVRTLQKWSDILLDTGYVEEAAILLQFAVSTGTDVCRTYEELADYWISRGEPEKLDYLIARADALNTSTKVTILRKLREKQHTV